LPSLSGGKNLEGYYQREIKKVPLTRGIWGYGSTSKNPVNPIYIDEFDVIFNDWGIEYRMIFI